MVSDGKEYGSKATWKEVVRYLQTNNIAVYATLVGDSARWGEGGLTASTCPSRCTTTSSTSTSRPPAATCIAEGSINSIEKSYAKIADEARNQYTLGYLSHESIYDGKYRNIDVRVDRPNVVVTPSPATIPPRRNTNNAPSLQGVLNKHGLCKRTGRFIGRRF